MAIIIILFREASSRAWKVKRRENLPRAMPRCCSKRKKAANRSPTNGRATPQIGVSQRYSRKKYGKTCNADATHRLVGQGGNARLAPTRPCVIIDQLGEISWPKPSHVTRHIVSRS